MFESNLPVERTITRRIFEAWSVDIPARFAESFVEDGSYWHAFDDERSVSLSSIVLRDAVGPVTAERILREPPRSKASPSTSCRLASWVGPRADRRCSLRSPRTRCPAWSSWMDGF
jgi:hypothetical protein